jgi:hypothetical protein
LLRPANYVHDWQNSSQFPGMLRRRRLSGLRRNIGGNRQP